MSIWLDRTQAAANDIQNASEGARGSTPHAEKNGQVSAGIPEPAAKPLENEAYQINARTLGTVTPTPATRVAR